MSGRVELRRLGVVEYLDGLELQRQFQQARRDQQVPDTLLLLQHPAVLTLGRAAKATNIIAPQARLEALGVEVHETDRGGDVTYHGPGQIVGYPLLHLTGERQDVRKYVRSIEELMIRTVAEFGITAERIEKWPGVFVTNSRRGGPRKIAALGVHLSRWHTRHGFALNVHPDLRHFELIVPCGIREAGVTSIFEETGVDVPLSDVEEVVARHFRDVFECELESAPRPQPTVCVVVHDAERQVLLLKRTEARGGFWQPVTGRAEPGEGPLAAAVRELHEETQLPAQVRSLGYTHAFAFGASQPPDVYEETAFAARCAPRAVPSLDPAEHVGHEWVTQAEALNRLPFAGLRRAVRLALEPSAVGSVGVAQELDQMA